jgi:divalent metal cation (Fe/Co/Zn/Cd) transporter
MIGVLLIVVAVFIAIEVKAMLIGQSVEPSIAAEMRRYLEERPEVKRVLNLITFQLGNDAMIAVKAQMATSGSAAQLLASVNAVEVAFKQRFPQVRWSFFEPDEAD